MLPPGAFKTHERILITLQLGVTVSSLVGSLFMRDCSNELLIAIYFLAAPTFAVTFLALVRRHNPSLLVASSIICFTAIVLNMIRQPMLPAVFSYNREAFLAAAAEIKAGARREKTTWIGTVPIVKASECRPGVPCFYVSNDGAGATIIASIPCSGAPFNVWVSVDLEPGWCWIRED